MIVYSVPKPMVDPWKTLQEKSFASWGDQVRLLGSDSSYYMTIETTEEGTPLLSSVLTSIDYASPHHLVCLVNADILLTPGFFKAVDRVVKEPRFVDKPDYFIIGRRIDLPEGKLHPGTGVDYFVYHTSYLKFKKEEVPPLAYGRTAWDNWLVWKAKNLGCTLVDITKVGTVFHQFHDYSHHSEGKKGVWEGDEARTNQRLVGKSLLTIDDSDLILNDYGLRVNPHKYLRKVKSLVR